MSNDKWDGEGRKRNSWESGEEVFDVAGALALDDVDTWNLTSMVWLGRAGRLWEQILESVLRPHGLNPAELRVLGALLAITDRELTLGELRQFVAVTPGGVTKIVVRLEALGLVRKRPSQADKRVVHVKLTRAGIKATREATRDAVARFSELFSTVSDRQKEAISCALQAMLSCLPGGN